MRVVTDPKQKQQPVSRPEARNEGAILVWLDALVGGICPPDAFLRAMREQFPGDSDGNWEVLALLDQYYRLGKINADVFRSVKAGIEDTAFGSDSGSARVEHTPTATEVVFAPPRTNGAAPRFESATTTAPVTPAESEAAHSVPTQNIPVAAPAPVAAPTRVAPAPVALAPRLAPVSPISRAARAPEPIPRPSASAPPDTGPETIRRAAPADEPPTGAHAIGVGDVLRGRYKIRRMLGEGGMGTVFEAVDTYRLDGPGDGQRVAIKVLHADIARREELLAELQFEFQLLQSLSHPNIVRVHEIDRDGEIAFFTMELLIGTQLARVLGERNAIPLPRRYSFALIRDLGAALAHAHEHGAVHGDINPQNIFINNDGELRVLDFGATSRRTPVATPGYASCQVLEGQHPDRRDDAFAFACVAYAVLSGQHPFGLQSALQARLQRIRPSRPAVLSRRQWRVLREGLRWDRDARPADIRQWLARLNLRGAVTKIPSLPALLSAAPERKSYALRAAAVIFVSLLIGVGYWATSDQDLLMREARTLFARASAKVGSVMAQIKTSLPHSAPSTPETAKNTPADQGENTPAQPRAADESASPPHPATLPVEASPPPAPALRATVLPPTSTAPAAAVRPPPTTPARQAPAAVSAPASVPAAPPRAGAPAAVSAGVPAATAAGVAALGAAKGEPRLANPAYVKLEMVADTVDVLPSAATAQVTIRRRGSLHGDANFTLWTESGTAKPGKDFSAVMPHVEQIREGSGTTTVSIPVSNAPRTKPMSFYVVIDQTDSGPPMGGRTLTMVTLQPEE